MRSVLMTSLILPVLALAAPVQAQDNSQGDGPYLQNRASKLYDRIELAKREHLMPRGRAQRLQMMVRRIQVRAGNEQTRDGQIDQQDADTMNQQLTDVERALP